MLGWRSCARVTAFAAASLLLLALSAAAAAYGITPALEGAAAPIEPSTALPRVLVITEPGSPLYMEAVKLGAATASPRSLTEPTLRALVDSHGVVVLDSNAAKKLAARKLADTLLAAGRPVIVVGREPLASLLGDRRPWELPLALVPLKSMPSILARSADELAALRPGIPGGAYAVAIIPEASTRQPIHGKLPVGYLVYHSKRPLEAIIRDVMEVMRSRPPLAPRLMAAGGYAEFERQPWRHIGFYRASTEPLKVVFDTSETTVGYIDFALEFSYDTVEVFDPSRKNLGLWRIAVAEHSVHASPGSGLYCWLPGYSDYFGWSGEPEKVLIDAGASNDQFVEGRLPPDATTGPVSFSLSYKPGGGPPSGSVTIQIPRDVYMEPRYMYRPGYLYGGYQRYAVSFNWGEDYGTLVAPPSLRLQGATVGAVAYVSAPKPGSYIEHGVDAGGLYLRVRVESRLYCTDALSIPYYAGKNMEIYFYVSDSGYSYVRTS